MSENKSIESETPAAVAGAARGSANTVELIGAGICDACGEHVEQLMVMNQRGGRGVTAIAGLCSCQKCAGSCWPNADLSGADASAPRTG